MRELLAEYAANASASSPQKEYGYRNGQLLITAEAGSGSGGNPYSFTDDPLVAGTTVVKATHLVELRTAVNQARAHAGLPAATWTDDPVQATITAIRTVHITELRARLDEARARLGLSAANYTDPTLTAGTTTVKAVHLQELRAKTNEALTAGAGSGLALRWLVTDHLGTPRMVIDKSGTLSGVSRHDYLPFGEELFADAGGRTTAQGYTNSDGARQKFTQKERDNETGLDYFISRSYSSAQGRFTTADSWAGRGVNPQSFNRYSYVVNNPLKYVDPWGRQGELPKKKGKKGQGEEEIPPDRENDTDDGECPCPVYITPVPAPLYIPTSTQMISDWWLVLGGRLSFNSYMRNYDALLNARSREGDDQGRAASKWLQEGLESNDLQFALTMTGAGSLLGAEDAAYVTVGRWMSQLELDAMMDSGIVQLSKNLPQTNVAIPANASAFIRQAEVGSLYVEFNVPRASVVRTSNGWGLIPGPNSVWAKLARIQGKPVPQMPAATDIVHKATKIRN